jgi:hypothetical protein
MGPYFVTPAARYIASFLGLFVPNSLTVRPPVVSSGFRCPSSLWRPAGYHYIRPVLKPARPERLPDNVFASPDCRHPWPLCFTLARSFSRSRFTPSVALTLGVPGALLAPLLLALRRASTPPQCPILRCPNPGRRSGSSLCDHRPDHIFLIPPT